MLRSIARGAERIKSLAQSLLAFSRPAQEEPVPLAVERRHRAQPRAVPLPDPQGRASRSQKQLAAGAAPIMGVSNQLEIALINLVVNAVHAMEGGGTLMVASGARGGDVEIVVADTGHGIPEEIQLHDLRALLYNQAGRARAPASASRRC